MKLQALGCPPLAQTCFWHVNHERILIYGSETFMIPIFKMRQYPNRRGRRPLSFLCGPILAISFDYAQVLSMLNVVYTSLAIPRLVTIPRNLAVRMGLICCIWRII